MSSLELILDFIPFNQAHLDLSLSSPLCAQSLRLTLLPGTLCGVGTRGLQSGSGVETCNQPQERLLDMVAWVPSLAGHCQGHLNMNYKLFLLGCCLKKEDWDWVFDSFPRVWSRVASVLQVGLLLCEGSCLLLPSSPLYLRHRLLRWGNTGGPLAGRKPHSLTKNGCGHWCLRP